ncbi:MAG: threonine/serine dehydratase [Pseudomonadota bacterium]
MPSSATSDSGFSLADIEAAARRLEGVAVRTPVLEAHLLNARVGGRLLIKAEPLQRTGSFKFRGAYNRISQIPDDERPNGVVAYSSGNHAQGVAAAAQLFGIPATIIMPADAPAIKRANTEAYGAKVIAYNRYREVRETIGERLAAETGATLVRPYDDHGIMAGQGTVGLEATRQIDAAPDAVLCCCGGGGLIAGVSTAVTAAWPDCPVYAVEPAGFDDTARSLTAGAIVPNDGAARSICDALLAAQPGDLTFAVNRQTLAGGLVVTDDEVRRAMAVAFETLKLVVEPGGAVALAAALFGKIETAGRTTLVIASGGNADPALFAETLEGRVQA